MIPEFKTEAEKLEYCSAALEQLLEILLEHRVINPEQHQQIENYAWSAMHRLSHHEE